MKYRSDKQPNRVEHIGELVFREQLLELDCEQEDRRFDDFYIAEMREFDYVCKVEQLLEKFGYPYQSTEVEVSMWSYTWRQN